MTLEGPPEASLQGTTSSAGRLHHGAEKRPWKGLSPLVLAEAGVSIGDDGLVKVPSRGIDGTTIRTHYFKKDGTTWWSSGVGLTLFGLEMIHPPRLAARRSLILVEGESSTLAVRQSFDPTFACVLGIPGAGTWRSEWAMAADNYERVYVIGDADDAGRRMVNAVLRDVPWGRRVELAEGDDPRDLLQRDGNNALDELIKRADLNAALFAALRTANNLGEFRAKLLATKGNGS